MISRAASLTPRPSPHSQRFIDEGGAALARFCRFEAISEARNGQSWRMWPQELREARDAALSAFASEHATRVQFHQFLQWLADAQFAHAAQDARAAGLSLGFCRDLAIGAAPDGAESWSRAGGFVEGFSIGAPPDAFSREGQNWGLPPPNPIEMEKSGGADFAELLRANMRHAGALRIDHVMGLARLFVIPDGEKPAAGAYRQLPVRDLAGSARARKPTRAMRRRRRRSRHGAVGLPRAYRTRRRAELPGSMVRTFGRGLRVADALSEEGHGLRFDA